VRHVGNVDGLEAAGRALVSTAVVRMLNWLCRDEVVGNQGSANESSLPGFPYEANINDRGWLVLYGNR
jgi:hypothetical protein